MHSALTRTTRTTRNAARTPLASVAVLSVLALAACGGRTDVGAGTESGTQTVAPGESTATDGAATAGGETTGTEGTTTSPPLGTIPSDVPGGVPTLTGRPGASATPTPPPFDYKGPINTNGSKQDNEAAINASYDTFISNLSGLFQYLSPQWRDALSEVASPQMTLAATRTAVAIQKSKSHTIGSLRDSSRVITIKGNEALVTSCLDEKNWYAVKDETGQPDPGITRGYFTGRATFVFTSGRWYVNTWNSLPQRCRFINS